MLNEENNMSGTVPGILAHFNVKIHSSYLIENSKIIKFTQEMKRLGWARWFMLVIPALWEAEVGESLETGRRRLQ